MYWPSIQDVRKTIGEDENIRNLKSFYLSRRTSARSSIARYFSEKVPIIQWLPGYSKSWIINDLIAGLTIGVLLVPQSLAYASAANLSGHYGLISSWLPMLIYAIMGTSKDTTTGPTAIMALLTGEIVTDLEAKGYTSNDIATAVAFMCGIYGLGVGLLKLGFLLDFIPIPVLSGYVSAAALTIVFQQIPTLFGETGIGSSTSSVIHDFFTKLPNTLWRDFLVGLFSLVMLLGLQYLGQRLGKRYRVVWFLCISRNALVLILFTGVSYGVNRGRANPLFAISKTTGSGIDVPRIPEVSLMSEVAGRSVAVFLAAALEHLAIGKAFGRRHRYQIDQSQELLYIGVVNFVGSFFHAMPVTGGFSRTAVNSESGVKSPLSGIITSACVLISIYKLAGAFYWIPKATLSAIIIVAVFNIILPPKLFYHYWKTSFADFVGSMVSFWVTLFVSVEYGIASAVGYSILYLLLRMAFTSVQRLSVLDSGMTEDLPDGLEWDKPIPDYIRVFRVSESILSFNAPRIKASIMQQVRSSIPSARKIRPDGEERLWNQPRDHDTTPIASESQLKRIIIDFSAVNHIDTSGVQVLADLQSDLQAFVGSSNLAFIGMSPAVKKRFERAQWQLSAIAESASDRVRDGGSLVFDEVQLPVDNTRRADIKHGIEV